MMELFVNEARQKLARIEAARAAGRVLEVSAVQQAGHGWRVEWGIGADVFHFTPPAARELARRHEASPGLAGVAVLLRAAADLCERQEGGE